MDYFRHCYNYKDIQQNLLIDLANFGFVDKTTREPVYDNLERHTLSDVNYHPNWKILCWKNDLLADFCLHASMIDSGNMTVWVQVNRGSSTSISNWDFNNTYSASPNSYPIIGTTTTQESSGSSYSFLQSIIMVPLINGGFLYNYYYIPYGSSIDPTPKLNIMGGTEYKGRETRRTIIGLPSTINSNLKNYLYFGLANCRSDSGSSENKYFLTDYQQNRAINNIPFVSASGETYVDTNSNICTLIKMPYDNGYLDNVYLLATAPGELTTEGSFFSFSGRNFINVYKNLVLELPS